MNWGLPSHSKRLNSCTLGSGRYDVLHVLLEEQVGFAIKAKGHQALESCSRPLESFSRPLESFRRPLAFFSRPLESFSYIPLESLLRANPSQETDCAASISNTTSGSCLRTRWQKCKTLSTIQGTQGPHVHEDPHLQVHLVRLTSLARLEPTCQVPPR